MGFDGITTRAIVDELNEHLSQGVVKKVMQPHTKILLFHFFAQGTQQKLLISADSSFPRLHRTNQTFQNPMTPPNFCMLLRKHLTGYQLHHCVQQGLDRCVHLIFHGHNELGDIQKKTLVVELMGKHSNIILLNSDGVVIDAITRVSFDMSRIRQIYPSKQYTAFSSHKVNLLEEKKEEEFWNSLSSSNQSIGKRLSSYFEGVSSLAAQQLCLQAQIDGSSPCNLLTETEKFQIHQSLQKLKNHLLLHDFQPVCYLTDKREFYCFPLLGRPHPMEFDTMSDCIDYFSLHAHREDTLGQRKKMLLDRLRQKQKKKSQKLSNLVADYEETNQRERWKEEADLLSITAHSIAKGQRRVIVEDVLYGRGQVEIALDPKKSVWENIEKKYQKFRKLNTARHLLEQSIPQLEEELVYLESLVFATQQANSMEDLEAMQKEYEKEEILQRPNKKSKKISRPLALKPRTFQTAQGTTILVGRNNTQNDALTLKSAEKEEWFFHAKDIPGAHVILCTKEIPSPEDLHAAAYLAAYYSSQKEEDYVEIDYTRKKHVYKAKGAKPGLVYYRNQHSLRISTKIPPVGLQCLDETQPATTQQEMSR